MKRPIIIFGSAPDTYQEIAFWNVSLVKFDYMAVGMDAVELVPWHLKYVVTNHHEDIIQIRSRRYLMRANIDYKLISYKDGVGVDIVLKPEYEGPSGSSSIVGCLAAIMLGYEKIILCGCPLSGNAPEGNPYSNFRLGWIFHYGKLKDKVRSCSGWTKDTFGFPTAEWLGFE